MSKETLAKLAKMGVEFPGRHDPVTLGDHIRRYRMDAGFYLGAFARQMEMSVVLLSSWERDKEVPSLDDIDRIGARLGLTKEKGSKLYWLAVEALKVQAASVCPTCGHDKRRT